MSSVDVSWIRGNFNSHVAIYERLYRLLDAEGFMSAKVLLKAYNQRYPSYKDGLLLMQVVRMLCIMAEHGDGKYVEVTTAPNHRYKNRPFFLYRRKETKNGEGKNVS